MGRQILNIEVTGGANLGRCYTSTTYRVTSRSYLGTKEIDELRKMGYLGYGQEFYAKYVNDSGQLEVLQPTGNPTDWQERNALPKPTMATPTAYDYQYVYEIETRCDSGD